MDFFAILHRSTRSSRRVSLRVAAPPALILGLALAWPGCSSKPGGLAGLEGGTGILATGAGGGASSSSSSTTSSGTPSGGTGGSGAITCGHGATLCGSTCAALANDPANCGGCGTACTGGKVCDQGKCTLECAGGASLCGASCVDEQTDPANCGACGNACTGGAICDQGQCALACVGGTTKCGSVCADLQVDTANCGVCGMACPAGDRCDSGVCTAIDCSGGTMLCGGVCTYVVIDPNNCGMCGNICPSGPNSVSTCQNSTCGLPCTGTYANCDGIGSNGCEVDLATDPLHCGACNAPCAPIANGTVGCAHEVCDVASCQTGYGDCNKDPSDGCETDLTTDSANCGACGAACLTGAACSNSVCGMLRRVFVSSAVYSGNLGGLAGADTKCQALADAAKLGGTFMAWLSDSVTTASARLDHWPHAYTLVDGTIVAASWTALTGGTLMVPISLDEAGQPGPLGTASCGNDVNTLPVVWTGSTSAGLSWPAGDDCADWTSAVAAGHAAEEGNFLSQTSAWTSACQNDNCSELAPIYCIEQ